ncbi:hypothetical protein AAG570_007168 [Ranatra chinensis]|uniref:Uncharacterized protein n=1 Tax=Ranatra chinensis TaxID=642074 RepID=A0ABD0XWB0_9HEMI
MVSKRRNMFYENKKQETTEIVVIGCAWVDQHRVLTDVVHDSSHIDVVRQPAHEEVVGVGVELAVLREVVTSPLRLGADQFHRHFRRTLGDRRGEVDVGRDDLDRTWVRNVVKTIR